MSTKTTKPIIKIDDGTTYGLTYTTEKTNEKINAAKEEVLRELHLNIEIPTGDAAEHIDVLPANVEGGLDSLYAGVDFTGDGTRLATPPMFYQDNSLKLWIFSIYVTSDSEKYPACILMNQGSYVLDVTQDNPPISGWIGKTTCTVADSDNKKYTYEIYAMISADEINAGEAVHVKVRLISEGAISQAASKEIAYAKETARLANETVKNLNIQVDSQDAKIRRSIYAIYPDETTTESSMSSCILNFKVNGGNRPYVHRGFLTFDGFAITNVDTSEDTSTVTIKNPYKITFEDEK